MEKNILILPSSTDSKVDVDAQNSMGSRERHGKEDVINTNVKSADEGMDDKRLWLEDMDSGDQ